jgi:hypothetical protein
MKTVFLIVLYFSNGHGMIKQTFSMSNMQTCTQTIQTAVVNSNHGARQVNNANLVMFCANSK